MASGNLPQRRPQVPVIAGPDLHLFAEPFDDGDESHIWCCRRDRAICGERIDPEESTDEDDGEDDAAELCETCRWKEAVKSSCGRPLCRLRRRWRERRSS